MHQDGIIHPQRSTYGTAEFYGWMFALRRD